MIILKEQIARHQLSEIAGNIYGNMVKAVVDVSRNKIAIDAELHSDLESLLLEDGSYQEDLWGINLYPEIDGEDFIEFDSLINIRPRQNNRSRGVESESVRNKISELVNHYVAG